jgi:hypothetical protein
VHLRNGREHEALGALSSTTRHKETVVKGRIVLGAAVFLALGFLVAGSANATQVEATFVGVSPPTGVKIHLQFGAGGVSKDVTTQAGIYRWHVTKSDFGELVVGDYYGTNCFDTQTISGGKTYTYNVYTDLTQAPVPQSAFVNPTSGGKLSSTQVDLLQSLFYRNAVLLWYAAESPDPTLLDPTGRVAIQLAVWEIVWEHTQTSFNLTSTSGSFYVTDIDSTYTNRAALMLANLAALSPQEKLSAPTLYAFVNDCSQDQMWLIPGGGGPPIPEPLTILGVFLGLGGVGVYIRKRRRV